MNRRGFLGRVIGTLVASQTAFVAELPGILCKGKPEELFGQTDSWLAHCTGLLELADGTIKASPIRLERREAGIIIWRFADWMATQGLTVCKAGIVSPWGVEMNRQRFHYEQWMTNGDVLKVTYSITRSEPQRDVFPERGDWDRWGLNPATADVYDPAGRKSASISIPVSPRSGIAPKIFVGGRNYAVGVSGAVVDTYLDEQMLYRKAYGRWPN